MRKAIAAWRGANNVIQQDAIFIVFDDGSVVECSNHKDPVVLVSTEQIEYAFSQASKPIHHPVGIPGERDPEFPCTEFTPGPVDTGSNCVGDGHDLCNECMHFRKDES